MRGKSLISYLKWKHLPQILELNLRKENPATASEKCILGIPIEIEMGVECPSSCWGVSLGSGSASLVPEQSCACLPGLWAGSGPRGHAGPAPCHPGEDGGASAHPRAAPEVCWQQAVEPAGDGDRERPLSGHGPPLLPPGALPPRSVCLWLFLSLLQQGEVDVWGSDTFLSGYLSVKVFCFGTVWVGVFLRVEERQRHRAGKRSDLLKALPGSPVAQVEMVPGALTHCMTLLTSVVLSPSQRFLLAFWMESLVLFRVGKSCSSLL